MRQPLRRNGLLVAGLVLVLLAGCEKAARYGAAPDTKGGGKPPDAHPTEVAAHYGWREPHPRQDRPIRFVTADQPRWETLREYWTDPHDDPKMAAALGAVPLGLTPLGAALAWYAALDADAVLIRVPLGLPDPRPHVPAGNPLTVAKWELGKKLFFDVNLLPFSQDTGQSCASCHKPSEGFTSPLRTGPRNALSLLNVVYNKQQFWDGRVDALEQVVQRDLRDEARPVTTNAERGMERHAWGGVVGRLRGRKDYLKQFQDVFGAEPTIDNVGRALATYLRTLLSGNSVYDLAAKTSAGEKVKPATLLAQHFAPHLTSAALARLDRAKDAAADVAKDLELGHRLFVKSRCTECHGGALFTDQQYHNTGIGDSVRRVREQEGRETGRFAVLPFGLKERWYVGAYRTPTLRNLPRTAPYTHDGRLETLGQVLRHYKELNGIDNRYLDPLLQSDSPQGARQLDLNAAEFRALELFLWALDGESLPARVTGEVPPRGAGK
jgi:cytochrome c peroxidase